MRKFLLLTACFLTFGCGGEESEIEMVPAIIPPGALFKKNEVVLEKDERVCQNLPQDVNLKSLRPLLTEAMPKTFQKEVLDSKYPIIVDFYASWCPYCNMASPYFHDLAVLNQQIKFVKYNVDNEENKDLKKISSVYSVLGYPSFRFFYLGNEYVQFRVEGADLNKLIAYTTVFVPFLKSEQK